MMTKYSTKRVKGGIQRKIIQKIKKERKQQQETGSSDKKLPHRERIGLKSKYEVSVVFEKPSGKLGVRKIFFGKHGEASIENREELADQMREQYCKLILDHPHFDVATYMQFGRFFNRKFWHLNLCWNRQLAALPRDEVIFDLCEQIKVLEKKITEQSQ